MLLYARTWTTRGMMRLSIAVLCLLAALVAYSQIPWPQAPTRVRDSDHEFDAGSRIALKQLTGIQVANLAMLGKVWGLRLEMSYGTRRRRRSGSGRAMDALLRRVESPDPLARYRGSMTRGACGEAAVRVTRDRETLDLKPTRVPESALTPPPRPSTPPWRSGRRGMPWS
jgi:hypothetical protein